MSRTAARRVDADQNAPRLSDPECERERRALLELGARIVNRVPTARFAFQSWFDAARGLSDAACTTFSPEAALARLAAELRRLWLKTAHKAADQHMRSPHHADAPTTAGGTEIAYGYERELRPTALEERCRRYAPTARGWDAAHVLFSSAQGGLASVLHWAQDDGLWAADRAPHVTLAGNYFETQELLGLFCGRDLSWSRAKSMDLAHVANEHPSRVLLIEPVFYDDAVNVFDVAAFHQAWHASQDRAQLIVLDTTLTGPRFPLAEFLAPLRSDSPPVVIAIHSGLKLDQAGLELASVGIASIYTADGNQHRAEDIAARLNKIRAATGVGLTLDEISALEAPWFLDVAYFNHYAGAVFENNAALAEVLNGQTGLFAQVLHPQFASAKLRWAQAPYCALRLREASSENYALLENVIASACERRGLLFDRGGSFGFRGHRYEMVMPEKGRGDPFLRVAMGARGGPSLRGIVALMKELAALPDIARLREAHKPVADFAGSSRSD